MKNAIRLVPCVLILLASGCSDRDEQLSGSQLPRKQYAIRDLKGEIPTSWTMEELREAEAKTLEQLYARAESPEQEQTLRDFVGAGRAGVYGMPDSIGADLIARVYAIRDIIRDRQRGKLVPPPYILDPDER